MASETSTFTSPITKWLSSIHHTQRATLQDSLGQTQELCSDHATQRLPPTYYIPSTILHATCYYESTSLILCFVCPTYSCTFKCLSHELQQGPFPIHRQGSNTLPSGNWNEFLHTCSPPLIHGDITANSVPCTHKTYLDENEYSFL